MPPAKKLPTDMFMVLGDIITKIEKKTFGQRRTTHSELSFLFPSPFIEAVQPFRFWSTTYRLRSLKIHKCIYHWAADFHCRR
jgi:hypothetical protein